MGNYPTNQGYFEDEKDEEKNLKYLLEKDGQLVPQLLLNDIFRKHVISEDFKKTEEMKIVCQRALTEIFQGSQCGNKNLCFSYSRLKKVERYEEGKHKSCCMVERCFKVSRREDRIE